MKFTRERSPSLGFVLPLLSVRKPGAACGEFPDIADLCRLAKSWDMNIVQILPVNDTGRETSPYSALSAFALHPVYLRIEDLPEIAELSSAGNGRLPEEIGRPLGLLAEEGESARVPYGRILDLKTEALRAVWKECHEGKNAAGIGARLHGELDSWLASAEWAKSYACFVELKSRFGGKPWWEWPRFRDPSAADITALWADPDFAMDLGFHAWIQMRAEKQFAAACRAAVGSGVDIMGDIPILMNRDSADVWRERAIFRLDMCAGAPPDMYSRLGQNWGFPLYRWDELERAGYSFWKKRLAAADSFYSAFRIDHVLGFFRIWAISALEEDGWLGSFFPEYTVSCPELASLGFDAGRIRWLSRPHVGRGAIDDALRDSGLESLACAAALRPGSVDSLISSMFSRIGDEQLYLFSPSIGGGRDIGRVIREWAEAAALPFPEARDVCLRAAEAFRAICQGFWRDRTLLEVAPGQFVPAWKHHATKAWDSLSEHEKSQLDGLLSRRRAESAAMWIRSGEAKLGTLARSVDMKACAEDLGSVPPGVPETLDRLGIPGLRVLRWTRSYGKEGDPFVPFGEYPPNSVACTSVHDSTNLRQWWEEEADRAPVWKLVREAIAGLAGGIPLPPLPPGKLEARDALVFLRAFSAARSNIVIFPLQDLLASSETYREKNPRDERINTPGTSGPGNWLYRMKPSLPLLLGDGEFAAAMSPLAAIHDRAISARSLS